MQLLSHGNPFHEAPTNESDKGLLSRSMCEAGQRWFDTRRQGFSYLVLFYAFVTCICHQTIMNPAMAVIVINSCRRNVFVLERIFMMYENIYDRLRICGRVFNFMKNIPQEKNCEGLDLPNWPKSSNIKVTNLSLKYKPTLPCVIKNLSLSINEGEKVGIIGRTGSGKSTLLLGLIRILEPYRENISDKVPTIEIDGKDIEGIVLQQLRRNVVMIPQEPWLFSGSIRENMNLEGKFNDKEIIELFEKMGINSVLEKKIEEKESSVLDINLSENGGNLSQGERQLLCIARALIKKPCILIMDEATANLDEATDKSLQKYLKDEMSSTTVLMVAHRNSSMVVCDRIINLSEDKKT